MGLAIIVPSISFDDANLGKVTLSGNVPIRGLYINLKNSYIATEVDLKCSYLPANTTQRNVIWSIESGNEYATISGSTLTILQGASNNYVTVKCTSVLNPTVTAEKIIKVTYDNIPIPIYSIEDCAVNGDTNNIIILDYNLLTDLPKWTFIYKATRNSEDVCNYFQITCQIPSTTPIPGYYLQGLSVTNIGMLACFQHPNSQSQDVVQLDAYDVKIALRCSNDILFYSVDGINWVNTNISVSSLNSQPGYDTPNLVLGGSRKLTTKQFPLQGSFSAYLFDRDLDDVSGLF